MMPKDLAAAVSELAAGHGADVRVVTGAALLDEGYPRDPCRWAARAPTVRGSST